MTRTGYERVANWNTRADGSGTTYYSGRSYTFSSATYLYAVWEPHTYTVTYNSNGGSGSMANQSFEYGTYQKLRTNTFTRDKYTFVGWATSSNGEIEYDDGENVANLTSVDNDVVTLFAIWEKSKMIFDPNGGSNGPINYATFDAEFNAEFGENFSVTKGNLVMSFDSSTGIVTIDGDMNWWSGSYYTPLEDGLFVARYAKVGGFANRQYGIGYEILSGSFSGDARLFYDFGNDANGVAGPYFSANGYSFNSDEKAQAAMSGILTSGGFDAEWAAIYFLGSGTFDNLQIRFNFVEDVNDVVDSLEIDDTEIAMPLPIREGYRFLGWNTKQNGTGEYIGSGNRDTLTTTTTLYAQWKVNSFKMEFSKNTMNVNSSGRVETIYNCISGEEYTLPENGFVNEGFVFKGWARSTNSSVALAPGSKVIHYPYANESTITYYAVWEPLNPVVKENGRWYAEIGVWPQTKETDLEIISDLESQRSQNKTTGITYSIAEETLQCYSSDGNDYAYYNGSYYKVEPVRYMLLGNFSSDYGTLNGEIMAISEKVVFASVFENSWPIENCFGKGYNDAMIKNNVLDFISSSSANEEFLNNTEYEVNNFRSESGEISQISVPLLGALSSPEEIDQVYGDLSAEFSDLAADILGGYLLYWTRDVGSNLNNAQTISAGGVTGTQMKMSEILGVRVTVNVKTLACLGP